MPNTTAAAPAKNVPANKLHQDKVPETLVIQEDLCFFPDLTGGDKKRTYITTHIKFGKFRKFTKIELYNHETHKGEQRDEIKAHVSKLMREMRANNFTPASLACGLRETHLSGLEQLPKGKVKLTISSDNPIPCLDGGHRTRAMEAIRSEAAADKQKIIDDIDVTFQIYLIPSLVKRDFRNLNDGRKVSRSQTQLMAEEDIMQNDTENGPVVTVSQNVVMMMSKVGVSSDADSFLFSDVKFGGGGSGKIDYSSLTGKNGSDIATSVYAGAQIVTDPSYGHLFQTDKDGTREQKCINYLVDVYKTVWKGIHQYDEKVQEVGTDGVPQLLADGNMLRPNRMGGRGTKSGTGLLIMLGNLFAFKQLEYRGQLDFPEEEVRYIVEVAQEVMNGPVRGGGSGPAKRETTGEFTKAYFVDNIREPGDTDINSGKVGGINGVPYRLCDEILTRSTFKLPKKTKGELEPADNDATEKSLMSPAVATVTQEPEAVDDVEIVEPDDEDEDVLLEEDDAEDNFIPVVKSKAKKSNAEVEITG